ncbi:MAG: hypothetical protein LBD08_01275 [Treponema sp.]|jgi:preprotein translocase subunit Sss1|nr:hypothetical protein [Treponema sp.]
MEKVVEELKNISKTLEGILAAMAKPENKYEKALTIAGTGVGALGIIHIIDTILRWVRGG